jgi:Flp pilus assembly protein TadD
MLDYTIWGLWPGGYHLTNIMIHAVNGLLVYRLLELIRGDRLTCLLGGMLFLLHPVQVESVAWISERKGLLAACFFLASWLGYLRYRAGGEAAGRYYLLSLAACLLSLLTKSLAVIMPVMLIMYEVCHSSGAERPKLKDKIPFLLLALLAAGVEIYSSLLQPGGAKGGYHGGSPLATLYTMLPVFCRYLGLLVWPSGLSIDYDPPVHHGVDGTVALSALLLAVLVATSVMLWRRNRRLCFWIGFFWLCLAPVSQIIPTGFIMFDHYLYLPVISMGVLVGSGASTLKGRISPHARRVLYAVLALWLCALSLVSFVRSGSWKDSLTLFSDTVRKSPHSFMAWWGFGNACQQAGMTDRALAAYLHASELKPDSTDVLHTLASLYLEMGMPDEAQPRLNRLLQLNPAYVRGWASMGHYYRQKNDLHRAREMYLKALELQPDAVEVLIALAGLAAVQGDAGSSLSLLERAYAEGWRDYSIVDGNRDFSIIQGDPRFISLMTRLFPGRKRLD